jgi:hypothetical protein
VAISAVDVISPAFQRMKQQLFQPFRFGQWIRFAIVGFLAGEMGPAGFNYRFPFNIPSQRREFLQAGPFAAAGILVIIAVALLALAALALIVVFLYLNSRMRFVLFDSVVNGECRIREFWSRRGEPAFRFFVWQILYAICVVVTMAIVVGVPLLFAFGLGVFQSPREHLAAVILGVLVFGLLFLISMLSFAVVHVLVKDFVVPQMAFENISVGEGWRRLWPMMKAEKGGYAGYVGMKIVLTIAAFVITGIAGLLVVLVLLIPLGAIGAAIFLGARSGALVWNPITIALAVICGIILLACLFVLVGLISAPMIVFFPAYSIYFFADRYPPLHAAMFPAPTPGPA